MLADTLRLIKHKQGVLLQIGKQADGIFIKIIGIRPECRQCFFRTQAFRILADMLPQTLCIFRFALLLQIFQYLPVFLLDALRRRNCLLLSINHFAQGEDARLLQLFYGTLALRIHTADGINFIIPEFDTHGILRRQRPDIQNTAAQAELPGTFHQLRPLIAHAYQLACQLCDFNDFTRPQGQPKGGKNFLLGIFIQQRLGRCYNDGRFTLEQTLQYQKPLAVHFHAMHIRAVEKDILRRIICAVLRKKGQILQNFLRAQFTVGQKEKRTLYFRLQAVRQMGFCRINDTCRKNRRISLCNSFQNLLKTAQFGQRCG